MCRPNAFVACETPVGRGVKQCASDGRRFSECVPVTLDAAFPPFDAGADTVADASDGADSTLDGNADGDAAPSEAGEAGVGGDAGEIGDGSTEN